FSTGDFISSKDANIDGTMPWSAKVAAQTDPNSPKGARLGKTARVGSYPPNPWGLYDMHGNVYEWTLDGQRQYQKSAQALDDPRGTPNQGLIRGGCWDKGGFFCRSSFHFHYPPTHRDAGIGFRVALDASQIKAPDNPVI